MADNVGSFANLLRRLESATNRLEEMTAFIGDVNLPNSEALKSALISKAESAGDEEATENPRAYKEPPEACPRPSLKQGATTDARFLLPKPVREIDNIIDDKMRTLVAVAEKIGSPLYEQCQAFARAFLAERTYIYVSTKARKPEVQPSEPMNSLRRASEEVNNLKEYNRNSVLFNHLSAIADGVMCLGWFFEDNPVEFIKEIFGSAKFYGNRVIARKNKEDDTHAQFISDYYGLFEAFLDYVQANYSQGLSWNSDGIDAMEAYSEIMSSKTALETQPSVVPSATPAPPAPSRPAPPTAPPAAPPAPRVPTIQELKLQDEQKGTSQSSDISALLGQLNQGLSITSTLKKVDKSQMTHKNPSLRNTDVAPEQPPPSSRQAAEKPKPEQQKKKTPIKRFDNHKWSLENIDDDDQVEIDTQISHSVLISNCNNAVFNIRGKCNLVSLINCNNVSVLADTLISSLEAIKCRRIAAQVLNTVPVMALDQIDGAKLYLSKESSGCKLLTSRCSGLNVYLPPEGDSEDADMKECLVSEQLQTTFEGGVPKTVAIDPNH